MNKILLIVTFFISVTGNCQRPNNTQISVTKTYYDNGNVKSEGIYTNGIKEGFWKTYFINGAIESEGKYLHGKKNGIHKTYRSNKTIKKETTFKNGKISGVEKNYFSNGQIESKAIFIDGKKTGLSEFYYKTGELKSKSNTYNTDLIITKNYHKNGKLDYEYTSKKIISKIDIRFITSGLYREYHQKNDSLKIIGQFSEGFNTGIWKSFSSEGKKEWELTFFENYLTGAYKKYSRNGNLQIEGTAVNNKKNGTEIRYYDTGEVHWKGTYLDDKLHGNWQRLNKKGILIENLKFNKGTLKNSSKSNTTLSATEIPDWIFFSAPTYPNCINKTYKKRKKCLSKEIDKLIQKKFNTNLGPKLGLKGLYKIFVQFIINSNGNITNINVKAPHPKLITETKRIMNKLPQLIPAKRRGKNVSMIYIKPIIFRVTKFK